MLLNPRDPNSWAYLLQELKKMFIAKEPGKVLSSNDYTDEDKAKVDGITGGGTVGFTTDDTLTLEDGVLSVNTADDVEADNTLPITSAAVHTTVGNIETILSLI